MNLEAAAAVEGPWAAPGDTMRVPRRDRAPRCADDVDARHGAIGMDMDMAWSTVASALAGSSACCGLRPGPDRSRSARKHQTDHTETDSRRLDVRRSSTTTDDADPDGRQEAQR